MKRRHVPVLLTVLALTAAATWADVTEEETVEQSASLGPGGQVVVEADNGSIRVDTWDSQEVRVVARKKARAEDRGRARELLAETEVRVRELGGTVRIDAERPRYGWLRDGSVSVSYELTIPSDAELEATTSNGSIEVSELGARARLETNNGSIKARAVGGPLDAHSNNGSIRAYDIHGAVRAETNNGSIEADIASSGLEDDVLLRTNNGSVELRLEAGIAASVDARTRQGTVTSDFPGGIQDRRRKTLDLDLAGGGPRIELESTNGSIRLRRR